MEYEYKKRLFRYIISKNYKIKKDEEFSNILFIIFKTFKIKCKYFLLFSSIKINNKSNLLWGCDNPYTSLDTHKLCCKIRSKIKETYITEKEEIIKTIIKNFDSFEMCDEAINLLWIIEDKKINYSSFYVITEIIYF